MGEANISGSKSIKNPLFSNAVPAAICAAALMAISSQMQAAPIQKLANHIPSAVGASKTVGPVSPREQLTLAIGLPLRDSQALDVLVQQIADPRSSLYRQYLSSSEFAERFGPTEQDYEKLIAAVQQRGFTVSGRHANRMILDVTGTVAAVNQLFNINLTVFDHPARGRFFAPDRDPSMDIDVQVLDVQGLDNFAPPKPMDLKLAALNSPLPLTTGSGPGGLFLGMDFRDAYAPGVTLTGAGQTLGLLEFDGFYAADVTANFKAAGMTAPSVSTVLLDGFSGAPGSSNIEVILDISMAGYMAPGVSIVVYEGSYPNDVLNRMATDNSARQLSCSWGYGINSTTEQIFKQMIAQGQSFFTASGDSGAYSSGVMPPADDPNVTSVGGTALTTTGPGGTWVSESAWNGSGGGVSTTYSIPSYQQSVNMAAAGGSATMRDIPDVALTGAVQMYLIYNNGAQTAVGGTSAATPLWAAFTALANQQAAARSNPPVGFMNPALYALGTGSGYDAAIHDITTGNNGFAAMTGYDLTTGWGSPAGQTLINDLSSLPTEPSFTLSATPNPATAQAGSSTTSTIQVTEENGFSGTVTLTLSGLPSGVTGTFGTMSASHASILTLAASSTAKAGTYPVQINGASGSTTASVSLNVVITAAPGFTLSASNPAITVIQGATGAEPITITPANGFTGSVTLTASGLPSGVTAAFSPASATSASTLTFTASATATAGGSTVTVTGKSGSVTSTLAIALTVAPPAQFSLGASAPAGLAQGATSTSTITVTPKSGFTGKVTLAASGLPAGVTVSFNPASTSTTSVATFSATYAATPATSTVIVTGTSGTSSATATLSLTVKAGPSFALAATPASLSMAQGTSATSTIAVTALNGFTGTPSLAVSGLPTGVTGAFTGTSLKLTAAPGGAVGAATVTVTGTSGALSAQTHIALTVSSTPSFKLTSSVSSLTAGQGGSASAVVSVAPVAGFTGAVALTATGLPAGVTASFSPASTTTSSTLTLKVAATTIPAASQIVITGASGSLSATLPVTLTVTAPPDFSIALAPANLHIVQGGQGSSAISMTPLYGFTGNVTYTWSGVPTGVTESSTTVGGGVVLALFTVSSAAVVGASQVTVTGTSGALTHSVVLSLTVVAPTAGTATADLSAAYNISGIAIDNVPFAGGGLDGGGRSYSGILLGASQTVGGNLFRIGPMGLPDAVSGTTVTLPAGQFSSLKMLATGVNGNQTSQSFTVTYSDGTTGAFTQSLSDWFTPQNYSGESQAMTMSNRDNSTGATDGEPFYLYSYSFALNSAKTVKSITLPTDRNVVVLAITLVGSATIKANAQVDLSKSFNGVGITVDGKTFTGGLDGVGYAYSGTLLNGSETLNGVTFTIGAAGQENVVSGSSGAIALPAGSYSSLQVLATGVNGAQLSQQFKVTYADGTSTTFTQSLSDWFTPANYAGQITAMTMPYRNASTGAKDNRNFELYQYAFSLNNTKTVSSVTLPSNSNVKVFAIVLKP